MSKREKNKKHLKRSFFAALAITAVVISLPLIIVISNSAKSSTISRTYAATNDQYGISDNGQLQFLSSTELNTFFDGYKAVGANWIRISFVWSDIQAGGAASYDWARYDAVVNAANAHGIKVLGMVGFTPTWARSSTCTSGDKCPPLDPGAFANFAGLVAARYAPLGVHSYEIWNEQNLPRFWDKPDPVGYTALLKAAYPAIKKADPTATVITGGTAPAVSDGTNISPTDYLTAIYKNGGQGYFDAVGHHPYCFNGPNFNCPTTFASWSAWSQMQDTNPSLRSVMSANGDQNKQIWATEFGAPTGGYDASIAVSEQQQAQMVTDAYNLFKSYSWSGPLFWYTYKDPCTTTTDGECYFGLVRPDNSHKPAYDAFRNAATAPTATSSPTKAPTATPAAATVTVTSLSEVGTSKNKPATANFTLQTTGSLTVSGLLVAVRKSGVGYDFPQMTNVTLSGTQSFSSQRTFAAGTYTYWVAYNYNGTWVDLSPQKTFTIK